MKIVEINTFIRDTSKRNDALGDLIRFAYKFFSHQWVDIVTSIMGTIIIAFLIGVGEHGVKLIIVGLIYALLLILSTWAKAYKNNMYKKMIKSSESLKTISSIMGSWQFDLYTCAKHIKQNRDKGQEIISSFISELSFQRAAFYVCQSIRDVVSDQYHINNDDIYITVFQRIQSDSSDVCKMIAYSCTQEPTTYGYSYSIPQKDEIKRKKIEFHTKAFVSNNTGITVALNQTEVKKYFIIHPDNKEREEKIQQYICFPISIAKSGVLFLLQVDTSIKGLFGYDDDGVKEFLANYVYPYGQFLHMVYEEQRTIEQLRSINYEEKNSN